MNEVLHTMAARYSCRAFTNEMPTEEQLTSIATAAIQAPSGVNRQGWRVIVVKNKDLIDDMENEGLAIMKSMPNQAMFERIQSRGGKLFYNAPCVIMVPIDPTDLNGAVMDCGILSEHVALAATSLGLGSCICGLAGLAFAGSKAAEFKQRLGFPTGFEFGIAILLGTSANAVAPHTPDVTKISVIE